MERGRADGLVLGGWPIGAELLSELEAISAESAASLLSISNDELGGSALWLRAEPGEDGAQSDALAQLIAKSIGPSEEASE